ncbi:Stealth CR1 domain-containing protein, partial [Kitasatospora sp. NPDC001574]
TYPLLDVFATALPDQVDFPVDAVITWVDDSDPAWQERRAAARARLAHTAAPIAPEDGVAASGIAGDAEATGRPRRRVRRPGRRGGAGGTIRNWALSRNRW